MSSRLIIALIIMLLAPGVQAHNFVTGKTVTPCILVLRYHEQRIDLAKRMQPGAP